jgi:hypothetical protein
MAQGILRSERRILQAERARETYYTRILYEVWQSQVVVILDHRKVEY